MGKRATGTLISLVVGLAACSGASRTAAPSSTTPASVASTSSTTRPVTTTTVSQGPPPEYSFDESVPPPRVLDTGSNYPEIVRSLGAYGNWLSAHRPDPALATRIIAPGTRLLPLFSRDLIRLRDNSTRLIEKVRGPGTYTVISVKSDAVSVRASEHILLHETVIARGKVTSLVPYPEESDSLVLIVLVGGHWRFAAYDPVQPAPNVHL